MNQVPICIMKGSRRIRVVEDARQRVREEAQLRLVKLQNSGKPHPKKAG